MYFVNSKLYFVALKLKLTKKCVHLRNAIEFNKTCLNNGIFRNIVIYMYIYIYTHTHRNISNEQDRVIFCPYCLMQHNFTMTVFYVVYCLSLDRIASNKWNKHNFFIVLYEEMQYWHSVIQVREDWKHLLSTSQRSFTELLNEMHVLTGFTYSAGIRLKINMKHYKS